MRSVLILSALSLLLGCSSATTKPTPTSAGDRVTLTVYVSGMT